MQIPLEFFMKFFPSASEQTQLIKCKDGVCYLPFNMGELPLDKKVLYEINGELLTILCTTWYNKIIYHIVEE